MAGVTHTENGQPVGRLFPEPKSSHAFARPSNPGLGKMPVSPSWHHLAIWVSDGSRKGFPTTGAVTGLISGDLPGPPHQPVGLCPCWKMGREYGAIWRGRRHLCSSNGSEHPRAPELHTCLKIQRCLQFSWPNPTFPNRSRRPCPLKLGHVLGHHF